MRINLRTVALAAFLTAAHAACAQQTGAKLESKPTPPYSETILAGDTLYVAGHLGTDAATGKVPADPEAEARLVMDAIKRAVEQAGLTMDDLVSVTVYCSDLDLFEKFNGVYRTYFHGKFPTRAFIGVSKLLIGAHFEVSAVAVRAGGVRKL